MIFIIRQHPLLHNRLLHEPDGRVVRSADVPVSAYSSLMLVGDIADTILGSYLPQLLGINRALQHLQAVALPDVQVVVIITLLIQFHFCAQDFWKPRIVSPCHLDHERGGQVSIQHESLVGVVGFQLRVEGHYYFAVGLAYSRNKNAPTSTTHFVRLFHPAVINALVGLDFAAVILNSLEGESSSVLADDLICLDLVEAGQAKGLNLVREQLMNALSNRILQLSAAENSDRSAGALKQQPASDSPRSPRASPAPEDLRPLRLKEALELLTKFSI